MASGYRDEWVTDWDTLRFQWWESGQSIADNSTTISWKLELIATKYGEIGSSVLKSWWVNVNGSYYEGTNNITIGNNTTKELASGSTTIIHDSDGNKTFSYSFSQYFGINFSGNRINSVSGSGTGSLTTIPRKATFISNGVSDFNDETEPTIYFNHPAGSALELQACIYCGEEQLTTWRVIDGTKDKYTFPLDSFQNNVWVKTIEKGSASIDITYRLATYVGNGFVYDISPVKQCTVINCAPSLNPKVEDQGSVSTTLTNNPDTMIRGYNYIHATFGDKDETVALKGATITGRSVTCGSKVLSSDGYFEYVYDNVFVFSVTDNRGQTTSITKKMPAIDYIPVSCNLNYETDLKSDTTTADIKIKLTGDYFNDSFGTHPGAQHNNLNLQWIYRKSTEEDFPKDENDNLIWNKIIILIQN